MKMGAEYTKYIKSDIWKAKCKLYWLKKGAWCKACGRKDHLHVHHMTYEHFRREPLTDLIGLCYDCHREVHKLHRLGGRQIDLRTVTMRYVKTQQLIKARRK